ncbi:hypothetical protein PENARI_c256G03699 [Penicillium arizonense]|uniref:Uncharacterized protein n=1 Tax=Penicillium arizonense TaxID=1835702 RepID=A0A1F5L076_PENAI|nr:hypothetical protein PENARI_c257G03467 [Penicillium arizonense]XP_022481918.1 hypothetical protein PENARI_c256G03699 [Penicillium arizonense]OGE46443.1 hypothetical protein PENARI_c257G03467 [Penicillium arizonense]OGE46447.1 hypothetical protein PENARI_c256G03699 [Penicillium arizonense]
MILASAYASGSLAGTLEIIDIDGQCAIWSYDNHGCTGSSEFFSKLDGDDCANLRVKTGTPQGYPVSGVGACGTEKNSSVAWIEVEHTGLVSFFNYQGDKSACVLRFDDTEFFVINLGVIVDYLPDRTFF